MTESGVRNAMKQVTKKDVVAFAVGSGIVLVLFLACKAGAGAGIIRRGVYPDPVCETCGKPLGGRETVCVPEGE